MTNRMAPKFAALVLAAMFGVAQAQNTAVALTATPPATQASLPQSIDGHWRIAQTGMWFSLTERFKMDDIRLVGADGFAARMSWWSATNRDCTVMDIQVTGTVKPDGSMHFNIPTSCYTLNARMGLQGKVWIGAANFAGSDDVPFDLRARGSYAR